VGAELDTNAGVADAEGPRMVLIALVVPLVLGAEGVGVQVHGVHLTPVCDEECNEWTPDDGDVVDASVEGVVADADADVYRECEASISRESACDGV
jgi:hypothetical protein